MVNRRTIIERREALDEAIKANRYQLTMLTQLHQAGDIGEAALEAHFKRLAYATEILKEEVEELVDLQG